MPGEEEKFVEGVSKIKIEKRIEDYRKILDDPSIEKTIPEYVRVRDVINEVINLLKKSNPKYSFVESEMIERRIQEYKNLLNKLDKDYLAKRKTELEESLNEKKKRLEELEGLKDNEIVLNSSDLEKESINKAISELEERIANREAMVAGRGDELAPAAYEQLRIWKQELEDFKAGKISKSIFDRAKEIEIATLTERIANREAMIAGRGDELAPAAYEQLKAWKEKLQALQNGTFSNKTPVSVADEKANLQKEIAAIELELENTNKALDELNGRDANDVEMQRRVIKHRIEELESINKEKELFRITDKGEIIIDYPDIAPAVDYEAAKAEYEMRKQDMFSKFYGDRQKGKEYADARARLEDHTYEVKFKFIDENGQEQEGTYLTVEPYSEMDKDFEFMQLEDYVEKLERLTKYNAGDVHAYDNVTKINGKTGEIEKVDPEKAREEDENYVESYNNAYNRITSTRYNLMTLGKYGEKVPYTEFQEKQPLRNIVRAVGNAAKFVRNHVTAPINKFVGSKIVSPIYAKVTGADDYARTAGLYSNKRTHRYVARRDYYMHQGKGYFASRFNAIFKAKEGNQAVLSAGAYDISSSVKAKYIDLAQKEAFRKKSEFASKSIEEKIKMIEQDLAVTQDDESKAKLEATLANLEKAREQITADKKANESAGIRQTAQTDAVDISQHDIANKENVTRTITGFKMLSRLGIRKLVGPKIKEWLLEHTKITETKTIPLTEDEQLEALDIPNQKWIGPKYEQDIVPITETRINTNATLSEMMAANAGKQIEGYYSVYGGETRPAMYTLTGNEAITGIFKQVDNRGTGLSDLVGLKAPTLTDGTFARELLDARGAVNQNISLDTILTAVNKGAISPEEINSMYVSVGDRFWAKLTDLCSDLTREVQIGTQEVPRLVADGYFADLTKEERLNLLHQALLSQGAQDKIASLQKVVSVQVDNPRAINALKGLGIALNGVDGALLAEDIYENTRTTDTNIQWEKPLERHYDIIEGITGDRRTDMKKRDVKTKTKEPDHDER